MHILSALVGALCCITTALAHMQLNHPPTFNATNNPHRTTNPDPYLQYPYDCCGPNNRWEYPCRGYLSLLDTPQGAPTATWEAGSSQIWNISGIGNHYGGSCQVGFSTDKGKTFRAAASYEGNCPRRDNGNGPEGQDFEFVVPEDLAEGVQVWAWVWYNREPEFFMNCAAVNITRPRPEDAASSSSCADSLRTETVYVTTTTQHVHPRHPHQKKNIPVPFNERPQMFIADDGNECWTPKETAELKYPDPGPVVVAGDGAYPLALPKGRCWGRPGHQTYHGN